MMGLSLSLALLGSVLAQDNAPADTASISANEPAVVQENASPVSSSRPAASSAVRFITTNAAPRPGTPTRTVCGWEGTTGSTMKRRVCRQVSSNSTNDLDNREMLRQLQGARVEPVN